MSRVVRHRNRQDGAVIITVSLVLLFLLGFMGIALDFGHLFIVKTELQTAMDSCALAAAQELDGDPITALTRARHAGEIAGNMNGVNFQSATWSGQGTNNQGALVDADITFMDSSYVATTVSANAKYAKCQHTQSGVNMWLLQSMGAFAGNTAAYPNTRNVVALAVATRASAQTTCPVPIGLNPMSTTDTASNNYGFKIGQWVDMVGNRMAHNGEMGWYNLNGRPNASETVIELGEPGYCGTKLHDQLGTPGTQSNVDVVWNQRFGIYKQNDGPSVNHPDFSGYAYTPTNWKNAVPQNAWSGTPVAGSDPSAANFKTKRAAFASFDDTGTDIVAGGTITGLDLKKKGFKTLATPGSGGEHYLYGSSRRLVTAPVLDATNHVIDYACMFMLQPLTAPTVTVQLEYEGLSSDPKSPCTTNGLAGGLAGPLVPVLVR